MNVSSSGPSNKASIFLGLIEYELNSLLGASHLVDYISVDIRFDLERYLLNIPTIEKTERKPCSIREQIIGIVMVSKRDFDNMTYSWSCNMYAL